MCLRRIFTTRAACSLILALSTASWVCAQQTPIAFVNVTVVPMNQSGALPGQTVVVEGTRITQTGPA